MLSRGDSLRSLLWVLLTPAAFASISSFGIGQEVVVESEVAARSRDQKHSDLLRPPGDGGYTDPIDWRLIPPARQTSFYGVRAQGTFFVFVVDCSGSMSDPARWLRLRKELRRTLMGLQFPQRYLVIFYDDAPRLMPGGIPASAGKRNTARILDWVSQITPEGGTEPEEAMRMALGYHPSAVFLLSDGEFPDGAADVITRANPEDSRIPVHCIDLSGGACGDDLSQIAQDSGGRYVTRP